MEENSLDYMEAHVENVANLSLIRLSWLAQFVEFRGARSYARVCRTRVSQRTYARAIGRARRISCSNSALKDSVIFLPVRLVVDALNGGRISSLHSVLFIYIILLSVALTSKLKRDFPHSPIIYKEKP